MNYLEYWNYWKAQLATVPADTQSLALTLGVGILVGTFFGWLLTHLHYRRRETFFSLANQTLNPLQRSLDRLDDKIRDIEIKREGTYASVTQHINDLVNTSNQLRDQTANLVGALKNPQIRGNWGEIQLRRVVEMAGMLPHCEFQEQYYSADGGARLDMIVTLPFERRIVVDSKVPIRAFLETSNITDEATLKKKFREHAELILNRAKELGKKEYWKHIQPSPSLIFMFLPGESFLIAGLQGDPQLIEKANDQRVILATPITMLALLRAVEFGSQQKTAAENADQIRQLGEELYKGVLELRDHFDHVGSSLRQAIRHFNKAVGSIEIGILDPTRQLKDLGAAGTSKNISTIASIRTTASTLQVTEMGTPEPSQPTGGT